MKKTLALVLALMLVLSTAALSAFAADTADVYVTISDGEGKLVLTQEKIDENMPKILEILAELPEYDELVKYYDKLGMLKTLREIGLPDDEEFVKKTFEFAPYVRKRMTLLRII